LAFGRSSFFGRGRGCKEKFPEDQDLLLEPEFRAIIRWLQVGKRTNLAVGDVNQPQQLTPVANGIRGRSSVSCSNQQGIVVGRKQAKARSSGDYTKGIAGAAVLKVDRVDAQRGIAAGHGNGVSYPEVVADENGIVIVLAGGEYDEEAGK